MHFSWFSSSYFVLQLSSDQFRLFVDCVQALTYLCYPLLGWLADTKFNHYSMNMVSVVATMLLTLVVGLVTVGAIAALNFSAQIVSLDEWYSLLLVSIAFVAIIAALGMFEANAIQFGLYQMLEANSDQLVTFIHWYYWSIQLSRGLMILVSMAIEWLLRSCLLPVNVNLHHATRLLPGGYILVLIFLIQGIMAAVGVFLLQHYKRHLNMDHVGHSPFTMIYRIVKYAWQHKCPVNRSAFTYWENDIPSRIDLGKNKYGGPFTNEEVEDTKTLFRILLLLFSLLGLHLSTNGFSVTSYLIRKVSPSAVTFLSLLYAPNIFSSVSIVVIVPLLHYVILPHFSRYIPNLLHRMGLCLAVILIQEVGGVLIASQAILLQKLLQLLH